MLDFKQQCLFSYSLNYKQYTMKKWLTLIGFCLANFSNGIGFGVYTDNLEIFANQYQTSVNIIQNTFYIGLVVQVLFCLPVIRVIEWRLDFSIFASLYLTATSYWLQYFSLNNIVILIAAIILLAIAQLFMLPTPLYLAEVWFPLEKRSLVIGLGFYSNLLGFGLGGALSSLLQASKFITVDKIVLIMSILSTISFVLSLLLVKNRPKVREEKIKKVQWVNNMKEIWKQKFTAYNILMVSVFLGVSWTFLSQFQVLQVKFQNAVFILNLAWIFSGGVFGIFMSWIVQKWLNKTGNSIYYDYTCKILLFVGILGNLVLGILVQLQIDDFGSYLACVIVIGIGTIGFFGLAYLSLIESIYPVPALLVGTLISVGASIYSILSLSVSQVFPSINAYFSISAVTILPWIYYVTTFKTNFKRYKYYLNEKKSKFELLKVNMITQKNDQ